MKPRENWGSHLGLLMATAGSAVGLGSLWKFPYVTGENGGGLFVLAYLFFTFFIGVPIFVAEMMIGREAERAPVGAYTELAQGKKGWRLLGWTSALVSLLILSFYVVVAGWSLDYTLMSLLNFSANKSAEEIRSTFDTLLQAGDINILFTALFLGLTTAIVYKGIRAGIEFWSKILMPVLFIILLSLFIYSMTLSGAKEAFSFLFTPKFDKLKPSSLLEALGLACFTLSVGMGILLTYGSYMKKNEDIPKTAITIATINILVSLIAALMIFPIIFTFGFAPEEGAGLLFKTMPLLFTHLPGTLLLSTTFFLLVVFAALTSAISVLEVLVATVVESFQISRGKATLIMSGLVFIIAIPNALAETNTLFAKWPLIFGKNFFDTLAYLTDSWMLPINALFTSIFAGWVFTKAKKENAFNSGSTLRLFFKPWLFLVRWLVPLAVLFIFLQQSGIINVNALRI